ncbi:MAG: hypothetical protein OEW67_09485 [Cyclobacteriaceae bacterium]|nr:hypothetical protein [Cyclobacteriaceae bacterium]
MKEQRISIQEPCHMSWKDLDKIRNSKNRHCSKCSIDIIDFTQRNNNEIIEYLAARKKEKVCAKMYSTNELSKLTKVQKIVLNWHENIKSNVKNGHFKSFVLAFVGLIIITTGSKCAVGEPALTCWEEFVPDTTTADPNDSTYVTVCN